MTEIIDKTSSHFLSKKIRLKRNSVFKDLVLYEWADIGLLTKIIHCNLLRVSKSSDGGEEKLNEKTLLQSYSKNVSNNLATVKYKRAGDIGRFYPAKSLGLHSIRKQTRHTLVNGIMTDIDISNCHPQLLCQMLQNNKYNRDYDMLTNYCENREKWASDIIDYYDLNKCSFAVLDTHNELHSSAKDIAKTLIIRILYGGSLDSWLTEFAIKKLSSPSNISKLIKQTKEIQQWVCINNPELFDMCKERNLKKKKDFNHEGTTVSLVLQEKECMILEEVYMYLVDNDYIRDDICSLCNDGIMIETKYYNEGVLDELSTFIKDKTGFVLKFVEKPLSDGYEDILDDHLIFDLWKLVYTEGIYADYFKLLYYKEFVVKGNILYAYNGVYWVREDLKSNSTLSNKIDCEFRIHIRRKSNAIKGELFAEKTFYEGLLTENGGTSLQMKLDAEENARDKWGPPSKPQPEGGGDEISFLFDDKIDTITKYLKTIDKFLRSVSFRDKLVKDCGRVLTNDFIKFDDNEYLLAFENKVYDLNNGDWVTPDYRQYISLTTGWKWVSGYQQKKVSTLTNLFNEIFPDSEMRDFYLQVLSTGIYGKVIQHFFVAKGGGGNGKSVINSLMMRAVGDYGYKLPSSVVSKPIQDGGNPAVAGIHNKRFVLFQEPEKKHDICCATVKEITGDKEIPCRTLYSTDMKTYTKCSLLGEFNGLPSLDEIGAAISRRLMVIDFESKFLTYADYEELCDEDKANPHINQANPYYTSDAFQDEYKQALISILFQQFKVFRSNNYIFKPPKQVRVANESYILMSDDFYNGFWADNFEEDENEFVQWCAVLNRFFSSKYYNNLSKKNKNTHTKKHVLELVETNKVLKSCFIRRQTKFNGNRLVKESIVKWKFKTTTADDEADDEVGAGYKGHC